MKAHEMYSIETKTETGIALYWDDKLQMWSEAAVWFVADNDEEAQAVYMAGRRKFGSRHPRSRLVGWHGETLSSHMA
jgi:hypothetical protein